MPSLLPVYCSTGKWECQALFSLINPNLAGSARGRFRTTVSANCHSSYFARYRSAGYYLHFKSRFIALFPIVFVGAIINRPVILENKITSPPDDKILFSAEIPIICAQIIGRAITDRPYDVIRSCLLNRNLRIILHFAFYPSSDLHRLYKRTVEGLK